MYFPGVCTLASSDCIEDFAGLLVKNVEEVAISLETLLELSFYVFDLANIKLLFQICQLML